MPLILVIDDEADTVTYFTTVLRDAGFETDVARDGREALVRLRARAPDLVTLDITMPDQSGVRVFREMKADPVLARVPVLVVTGISPEFREFISNRRSTPPPEGYIEKPVDAERLLAEVRRLLAEGPAAQPSP